MHINVGMSSSGLWHIGEAAAGTVSTALQVHVITGNPCVNTDIHVLHTLSACTLVSSYMLLSTLACKQLNFAMFLDIKIAWRQPHPLATVHELKP